MKTCICETFELNRGYSFHCPVHKEPLPVRSKNNNYAALQKSHAELLAELKSTAENVGECQHCCVEEIEEDDFTILEHEPHCHLIKTISAAESLEVKS